MKKIITAISLLAASNAYAEKVTAKGMQGYHVYQDSNGNKYVMHPTVPSVAYDLKGKQLDSVPTGYIKYATVKSDGTIVPMGENSSPLFSAISSIFIVAILGAIAWGFIKNKQRIVKKREELETIARLKENITLEAENIFNKYHKNFRPSQIDYLEQNVAPSLLSAIRGTALQESDFKEVNVNSLKVDKINIYREDYKYTASVNFSAVRTETNDGITKEIHSYEAWKLQMQDNKWMIVSITEVAPTTIKQIEAAKPQEKQMEQQVGGVDKFRL